MLWLVGLCLPMRTSPATAHASSSDVLTPSGCLVCTARGNTSTELRRTGGHGHLAGWELSTLTAVMAWRCFLGKGRRASSFGGCRCHISSTGSVLSVGHASSDFCNAGKEVGEVVVWFWLSMQWRDQVSALTMSLAHVLAAQTPTSSPSCRESRRCFSSISPFRGWR